MVMVATHHAQLNKVSHVLEEIKIMQIHALRYVEMELMLEVWVAMTVTL